MSIGLASDRLHVSKSIDGPKNLALYFSGNEATSVILLPQGRVKPSKMCRRFSSVSCRILHRFMGSSSAAFRSGSPHVKSSLASNASSPIGQPTAESHPHLLARGEVTPGITLSEFKSRRERLCESVVSTCASVSPEIGRHLIIIPASGKKFMSEKIPYVFRQATDFLYLTGCLEPGSLLCIVIDNASPHFSFRTILFVNPRDSYVEQWEGARTGPERTPDVFGVDEALPHKELEKFLACFAKDSGPFGVWYDYASPAGEEVHPKLMDFLRGRWHRRLESPRRLIHQLRLFKSKAEVNLLRRACEIASETFAEVMNFTSPGRLESDLWAKMEFGCKLRGANYLAYPPVVAGGSRANTIHYISNTQVLKEGELVLMDAGCYYHGYCSDVTRTWPVSGSFDRHQRALYELLLKVQQEMFSMASTHPTLDSLFRAMCQILGSELQHLGLLSRSLSPTEVSQRAYALCPHHVSHYLGMDVHDTGLISRGIRLEPGMVVTIEPGIYIDERNADVPVEFRGIGMRVEDDVVVTGSGISVLTAQCPSSVSDVERACKG